ncbi:MAG: hypothetical protein ACI8TQ_000673 [Planctomycetota bacterium]|jgi:hypothetical protein
MEKRRGVPRMDRGRSTSDAIVPRISTELCDCYDQRQGSHTDRNSTCTAKSMRKSIPRARRIQIRGSGGGEPASIGRKRQHSGIDNRSWEGRRSVSRSASCSPTAGISGKRTLKCAITHWRGAKSGFDSVTSRTLSGEPRVRTHPPHAQLSPRGLANRVAEL